MPTVLGKNGFDFMIYPNDHEPAHVHVFKTGDEIIINLGSETVKPCVRENFGMSAANERKAVIIAGEHQDHLLAKWREIHG